MGRLSTKWRQWVNRGGDLLFPPGCLFCHASMETSGCCASCLGTIKPYATSVCCRCGHLLSADLAPGPCGRCLRSPPFQTQTSSLFVYQGAVRDAILGWKLGGDDAPVRWLIGASEQRLKSLLQPDDLLIPVPMPLSRMRKSGLHHAAELAKMIAVTAGCRWDWQLLARRGEQERQSALSGVARRNNLRKSFCLNADYPGEQRFGLPTKGRLWVVDDILTTGATLHHAAKAMKPLRRPIHAFSLARTPHKGS